ncbi:MAG: manganese efflux pump [Bacteroidales bacterium]|nr:manganese efflux pump [Bacteroidales bacterium]
MLLALIFSLFQGGFPLLGICIGSACQQYIEAVDHWIAFILLAFVGGRMVWESLKTNMDNKQNRFNRASIGLIVVLAIATSIDAFVIGIGIGLEQTMVENLFTVAIIAVTTFIVSFLGVCMGRKHIFIPEKWSGIFAGSVLIGLGIHTLIEHLLL